MRRWTDDDTQQFRAGTHARLDDVLGAFPTGDLRGQATLFRVWAPGVEHVDVVGSFNDWTTGADPMARIDGTDVFEARVRNAGAGDTYKFRIHRADGTGWVDKADPFARWAETPPNTASRIALRNHRWRDGDWMATRRASDPWREPMSIYEVHLPSWRAIDPDDDRSAYRQLAKPLADHVRAMGFTHVELLPIMEHPFGGSWGYQCLGYFAPMAALGTPDDFAWFVDHLHRQGIGVILDWVPAHFPTDAHGLYRFTGEAIYEHPDPRRGYHPDWTTAIFDYGRPEVQSFLLSSARTWVSRFHADGLRVDAVASMLYLDYSRAPDAWIPNAYGGRENLDAIALLRRIASMLGAEFPDAVLIAEESTAFPKVSRPVSDGGLGFGFKWDMGWMNDTLRYFAREPVHRAHHHGELTFRAMYQHAENYVLPLSHDEVVHGKGSLLGKMPGDRWQRFANLRLLYATMFAQPGKQLLFMGSELAPENEWDHETPLPWDALLDPSHKGVHDLLVQLHAVYRAHPALWAADHDPAGFAWIDCHDAAQSLLAWRRIDPASGDEVAIAANLTPVPRPGWRLGLPEPGRWRVILDTDDPAFGGTGWRRGAVLDTEPVAAQGQPWSLPLDLPPLAAVWLAPV